VTACGQVNHLGVKPASYVDSAFYLSWDSKMSSNSFTWVMEGGDLGTADWGCLASHCASLCLQAARSGRAAGGSG